MSQRSQTEETAGVAEVAGWPKEPKPDCCGCCWGCCPNEPKADGWSLCFVLLVAERPKSTLTESTRSIGRWRRQQLQLIGQMNRTCATGRCRLTTKIEDWPGCEAGWPEWAKSTWICRSTGTKWPSCRSTWAKCATAKGVGSLRTCWPNTPEPLWILLLLLLRLIEWTEGRWTKGLKWIERR